MKLDGPRVIAIGLVAAARGALVLALLAPVQWLVQGWVAYHSIVLVSVAVSIAAGVVSASAIFAGVALSECELGPRVARYAAFGAVAVYLVVGMHSSWLMRPFLVRPGARTVPFLRHVEGDLVDAFGRTLPSFWGTFHGPAIAPCGGSEATCR